MVTLNSTKYVQAAVDRNSSSSNSMRISDCYISSHQLAGTLALSPVTSSPAMLALLKVDIVPVISAEIATLDTSAERLGEI